LVRREDKTKRGISPIYLAVLSGIILVILIINGILEINRTRKGFYLLLEREGTVLLLHFEKNIQETLLSLQAIESSGAQINPSLSSFFFGLEESVAEHLLAAAHRTDQMDGENPLDASDFQSIIDQYLLSSIEIFDPRGKLIRSWPSSASSSEKKPFLGDLIERRRPVFIDLFGRTLSEGQRFSIAILRKAIPGIIALHVDPDQMKRLVRQFAIQRAISDIGLTEDILYISVQDAQLNTLVDSDPTSIREKEEDHFLKGALQSSQALSRTYPSGQGEEIFEVVKSFSLKDEPMGLVRIGYSPKEIYPILGEVKKNVVLSVFFFLILGISAVTLIWVNQNRALKKMKEMEDRIQLAERLSSLGHLAAGVAHEIRNPLNAIGMGLQRLKREFLPPDESRKEEYLSFAGVISKEVRRVNGIIEQFLTLSRAFQLNLKESSFQDLLKDLITLFQEEASSQGIAIQAQLDSPLPAVKIDSEKLTQALVNIMKNGMQAMEKGGVLRIDTKLSKDHVEVVISDTGSGIAPDQMEKIFDYYYTTKERGVGLGLPIAHRIIEAHGGQLKLESKAGVGTKVTITLPI
jgi:signal transduction histidine kinase